MDIKVCNAFSFFESLFNSNISPQYVSIIIQKKRVSW